MSGRPLRGFYYLVLLALMTGGGCSDRSEDAMESTGDTASRPVVHVSNYPLQFFTERIASSLVEVRFPVPVDEDPAHWQPTPEEVLALQQSDLIVLNGASYESWLAAVSLPQSRLVITTRGSEDRLITLDGGPTHSHGPEGLHEHAGTAFTTWLDPTLAIAQARVIKEALIALLPAHSGRFEEQFADLARELESWDAEIGRIIATRPELPVLFSHPVYQYFEARYATNSRSVHWEPDEIPDDAMWLELIALVATHPAEWMIWEGTPAPRIVERLESIGIRSIVLDPCARTPASGDLAQVMERNLLALRAVFRSRP